MLCDRLRAAFGFKAEAFEHRGGEYVVVCDEAGAYAVEAAEAREALVYAEAEGDSYDGGPYEAFCSQVEPVSERDVALAVYWTLEGVRLHVGGCEVLTVAERAVIDDLREAL